MPHIYLNLTMGKRVAILIFGCQVFEPNSFYVNSNLEMLNIEWHSIPKVYSASATPKRHTTHIYTRKESAHRTTLGILSTTFSFTSDGCLAHLIFFHSFFLRMDGDLKKIRSLRGRNQISTNNDITTLLYLLRQQKIDRVYAQLIVYMLDR